MVRRIAEPGSPPATGPLATFKPFLGPVRQTEPRVPGHGAAETRALKLKALALAGFQGDPMDCQLERVRKVDARFEVVVRVAGYPFLGDHRRPVQGQVTLWVDPRRAR